MPYDTHIASYPLFSFTCRLPFLFDDMIHSFILLSFQRDAYSGSCPNKRICRLCSSIYYLREYCSTSPFPAFVICADIRVAVSSCSCSPIFMLSLSFRLLKVRDFIVYEPVTVRHDSAPLVRRRPNFGSGAIRPLWTATPA